MIPPAGVLPITTLGATFGLTAMLGLIAVLVTLAVIVFGLVTERRTVVLWRLSEAVPPVTALPPVDDYVAPWAA